MTRWYSSVPTNRNRRSYARFIASDADQHAAAAGRRRRGRTGCTRSPCWPKRSANASAPAASPTSTSATQQGPHVRGLPAAAARDRCGRAGPASVRTAGRWRAANTTARWARDGRGDRRRQRPQRRPAGAADVGWAGGRWAGAGRGAGRGGTRRGGARAHRAAPGRRRGHRRAAGRHRTGGRPGDSRHGWPGARGERGRQRGGGENGCSGGAANGGSTTADRAADRISADGAGRSASAPARSHP